MNKFELKKLIENYQKRNLSKEKMKTMDSWYHSINHGKNSKLSDSENIELKRKILEEINYKTKKTRVISIKRTLYAASILLISGLSYLFMPSKTNEPNISPGYSEAFIVDPNGESIAFTDLLQDSSYWINGLKVVKTSKDSLRLFAENTESVPFNNIIKTPSNGNIHLLLPDGTKVQINANSEVQFPSSFADKERSISLKGEALFDVAKSPSGKNFVVNLEKEQIIVKGTKFNVLYREEESSKTISLIEGVIAVENDKSEPLELIPGQQMFIDKKGDHFISGFDESLITAWSKGLFVLNGKNIHEILDEIKEWYQVEIVIDESDFQTKYAGQVSKFENIHDLLEILELTKTYTFNVEGRRIIAKKI